MFAGRVDESPGKFGQYVDVALDPHENWTMRPESSPSPRYEVNAEKIAHRRNTKKIIIGVDKF